MRIIEFSSDNFRSQVSLLQRKDGAFVVQVAIFKFDGYIPPLPPFDPENPLAFAQAYVAQLTALAACRMRRIGGPYDGQTFVARTSQYMKSVLMGIERHGYHVPECAYAALAANDESLQRTSTATASTNTRARESL